MARQLTAAWRTEGVCPRVLGVFKTTGQWKPGLYTKTTSMGPPPLDKETVFPPHPLRPGRVERPDLGANGEEARDWGIWQLLSRRGGTE